jgi:hypothetical protein
MECLSPRRAADDLLCPDSGGHMDDLAGRQPGAPRLLNVPHSPNPKPSWHGESVGHYEGRTLVVDTIALKEHPFSFLDNYRTPHTDQLHVVERYTLSADGKSIDVEVNVEDPGTFTTAWTARQRWEMSTRGEIEESVCAEMGLSPGADYFGLQSTPIPQTTTPDF